MIAGVWTDASGCAITRAIMRGKSRDSVPPGTLVAELGSGTGTKTRHVLEAMGRRSAGRLLPY